MPSDPIRMHLEYLDGDTVGPLGQSSVQVTTMPAGATIFQISAEDGTVYYEINGTAASANSPFYVADGATHVVGPLVGLLRLDVYSDDGGNAHIGFFKQKGE